jgi:hypothetical protein
MPSRLLLAIVLLISLIVLIYFTIKHAESLETKGIAVSQDSRSFYELSDGEKIQYIIDTYFTGGEEQVNISKIEKRKKEDEYIKSLPQDDTTCPDKYDGCSEWAANNECIINPEFMLYACPKSCKACALNEQQKYNLVRIYNTRDPPHCLYHGKGEDHKYPDPDHYRRQFDLYFDDSHII